MGLGPIISPNVTKDKTNFSSIKEHILDVFATNFTNSLIYGYSVSNLACDQLMVKRRLKIILFY